MLKILLLATLILLAPTYSIAQDSDEPVKVTLGAFYRAKRTFRGALIWDAPIMAVGPSFVFYNKVSLGRGGLSVFKNFGDSHTLTLGISAFDDNEPNGPVFNLEDTQEDFKNQRSSTHGTYLKYDFRVRRVFNFSLTYHKDLKRHYGEFFNARVSGLFIPLITTGIGSSFGDSASNKYAYGPEAVSGIGNVEGFVSLMLPFLPWSGRLITTFSRSEITQKENARADYIRGNKWVNNLSMIAIWKL